MNEQNENTTSDLPVVVRRSSFDIINADEGSHVLLKQFGFASLICHFIQLPLREFCIIFNEKYFVYLSGTFFKLKFNWHLIVLKLNASFKFL